MKQSLILGSFHRIFGKYLGAMFFVIIPQFCWVVEKTVQLISVEVEKYYNLFILRKF